MRKYLNKRTTIGLVGVVVALAAAGGAYAYFTSGGSGTGSGAVGATSTFTIAGAATNPLFPGSSSPVNITISNPGNGAQFVNTVHLASLSTGVQGCDPADFSLPDVAVNRTVPAGGNVQVTGTIAMRDSGVNQDACQNATLTLRFTSN
jgi:hypothetical protein